jgi:predicted ATPase
MISKEVLTIQKFFTIKYFEWETKDFNIITGDMGSGKSLCIKLLYFFQEIFYFNIYNNKNLRKESFSKNAFYRNLTEEFKRYFYTDGASDETKDTKIQYFYNNGLRTYDVSVNFDDNNITWKSNYFDNRLEIWKSYFDEMTGSVQAIRNRINDEITFEFGGRFPFQTMFIPASRAAASFQVAIRTQDPIFDEFLDNVSSTHTFLNRLKKSDYYEKIKEILNLKDISITKKNQLFIKFNDNRNIPLSFASSGEQELIYPLIFISYIALIDNTYDQITIFLEEPSAHLFPQEQKDTIEFIAKLFRNMENRIKIFITTHSPYVLNVINNLIYKGNLLERFPDNSDTINSAIGIPHLYHKEVSAFFIEKDGSVNDMIQDNDGIYSLYEDKIAEISRSIGMDTNTLIDLNNSLLNKNP